jgi:hypothetical protein
MVLAYHDFALKVFRLSEEGIFEHFPELFDCITPGSKTQRSEAEALVDLLHRHAASVLRVTEDQIVRAKTQLARRELPAGCLISLLGAGQVVQNPAPSAHAFSHTESYESVTYRSAAYSLTPAQACVVRYLAESRERFNGAVRHAAIIVDLQSHGFSTHKVQDLFKGSPVLGTLIQQPGRGFYRLAD